MSLDHRLQILIDDERHRRITAAAQERGVSVATIVREAIDHGVAAARAGVEALVSADSAFAGLSEICHVIPDRSGLSGLLNQ